MSVTTIPNIDQLIALFFDDSDPLGKFDCQWRNAAPVATPADQPSRTFDVTMPKPFGLLLAHQNHMTVTLESFHASSVEVEVLQFFEDGDLYCRKILLRRTSDRQVVMFGIVRLSLEHLGLQPRQEILSQKTPLGRVLISHGIMRSVQLASVWRIECGSELAEHFSCPIGTTTYGRTALIYFDDRPALELLEIVSPLGLAHSA
jgi:chorismate-pyruvate lyase